jgi:hypothetical protein
LTQRWLISQKSEDSKLCRINIAKWHRQLHKSILIMLDGIAGELEGPELEAACETLRQEWAGESDEEDYDPRLYRHGVVLYAAEALLVCRPDMSTIALEVDADAGCQMRPPFMRCLAQLTDWERVSGVHALTRQFCECAPNSAARFSKAHPRIQ